MDVAHPPASPQSPSGADVPASVPPVPLGVEAGDRATIARLTRAPLPLSVLRFGAPLALGMILYTAFNLIDMFMVSRLDNGSAALAALAVCDMIAAVAAIMSNGISTAAVAVISRRLGQDDRMGVEDAVRQSLLLVIGLSVVLGLSGVLGSEVIVRDLLQVKGEAASIAVRYMRVIVGGCYSIFLLLQTTAVLRALGHAKSSAGLLVAGNLFNVVLNILLIYGPGPHPTVFAWAQPLAQALGMPRLGAVGAAWATLIGRTLPLVVGLLWLGHRFGWHAFAPARLRPRMPELRTLVRLGWPSSMQLMVRIAVILAVMSVLNVRFTTEDDQYALTAYGICLRLETMVLFVGMGWGAAAATFVGVNVGAGQSGRAQRAGWLASLYNVLLTGLLVMLYLTFAEPIIAFFDPSYRVISVGREYLGIVGLSYVLLGVAIVLSQAMTGAGATLSSMLIDLVVSLGVVVPAVAVVALVFEASRPGLWLCIALGNGVTAAAYIIWYRRGVFLSKHV